MKRILLISLLSMPAVVAMHKEPKENSSTIQEVLKIVVDEQKRFETQLAELERYYFGVKVPDDACTKIKELKSDIAEKKVQARALINKVVGK